MTRIKGLWAKVVVGVLAVAGLVMAQRPRVVEQPTPCVTQGDRTVDAAVSASHVVFYCGAPTKAGGKCRRHVKAKGLRCAQHLGK